MDPHSTVHTSQSATNCSAVFLLLDRLTDQDATTEENISLLIVRSVAFVIICNALDHFYGASCSSQNVTKALGWQEDFSCWDVAGGISPLALCGTWR